MARQGYPAEFRRRVIELVEGGKKVAEVSRDLGISKQTIYVWRRQARIGEWQDALAASFHLSRVRTATIGNRCVSERPGMP